MFSYYGSKSKIIDLYPKPKHNTIIEPFAGSAQYSLKYFENDIIINDLNPNIYKLWKYLQECSRQDILSLPILKAGENLSNFNLSEEEKLFLGFRIAAGCARKSLTASAFVQSMWNIKIRETIANELYKIKHWTIINMEYQNLKNQKATYFIDPPYIKAGHVYQKFGNKNIDYKELAKYAKSLQGQVIFCEGPNANYLPFKTLTWFEGLQKRSKEVLWTK